MRGDLSRRSEPGGGFAAMALRAGFAGALVGGIDGLATMRGGRGLRDSLIAIAGCTLMGVCLALPLGALGLGTRHPLPRVVNGVVAVVFAALIPAGASLALAFEDGSSLLTVGSGAWLLVALAASVVIYRRGLAPPALSLALALLNVPALLTLHFLGAMGRVGAYPVLFLAAACGAWLLMLAQCIVVVFCVGAAGAARLRAFHRALALAGGVLCAGIGLYAVPGVYGALRWDFALLAWALFFWGTRGDFSTTRTRVAWLALAPCLIVVIPFVQALRDGIPLISSARGAELMNDLLAALQSPAERLEALKRSIESHPAYRRARAEHGRSAAAARRHAEPLNAPIDTVVLITIEASPYDRSGYSGKAPKDLTPHMDRLAAESLRFHDAYSPASCTLLTLPSIFNSQYPGRLPWEPAYLAETGGIVPLKEGERPPAGAIGWPILMEELPIALPLQLAQLGFYTQAILNGGNTSVFNSGAGLERGFSGSNLFGGTDIGPEVTGESEVSDHLVANAFEGLLQGRKTGKLFVWLHLYTPHVPYSQVPVAGFSGHLADIHLTDQVLGRVMKALDDSGRRQRSIVVLTADHGESLGTNRIGNPKMGRHGFSLQQAEVHVPLLVRAPGVFASDVHTLASGLDIAPTILSALGAEVPKEYVGEDLRLLAQTGSRPSTVFLDQWIHAPGGGDFRVRWVGSINDQTRLKTLLNERTGNVQSFDLRTDPEETENRLEGSLWGTSSAENDAFAELLGWRRAILESNPRNLDNLF